MSRSGLLYIGIQGHVLGLDRASGAEVWRCRLKGFDFVNVVFEDGELYATTQGELFRLDPATGEIRWQNGLKGLGRGLVAIAGAGDPQAVLSSRKQSLDAEAAAAATT